MNKDMQLLAIRIAESTNRVEDILENGEQESSVEFTLERVTTKRLEKGTYEYLTDTPESLCPVCSGSLEVQKPEVDPPDGFEESEHEFLIESTHREQTCGNCDSNGQMTCPNCDGSGEEDCSYCNGEGYKDDERSSCRECGFNRSSTGKVVCSTCSGSGGIQCNICRGEATIHVFKKKKLSPNTFPSKQLAVQDHQIVYLFQTLI